MPAGTHAGMGAISATIVEASLQQAAETMPVETADAEQEGADIEQTATTNAGVIKTIMDSVVCIKTTGSVSTFYGPMDASGAGSGVIISQDGYIVTCAHVISNATKIEVQDSEDNVYQASLLAYSDKMDLALLKIDAEGLTPAVLGDSASYSAGDPIYVVGNPLGNFVLSVSQGIISGVDRRANIEGNEMRLTQVDAAVNPGNSGGGLFDSQGRLIGIVNAKNAGIDVEGMGFAIPIDTVREVLKAMLQRTDLTLDL
jgi:serine protease Do